MMRRDMSPGRRGRGKTLTFEHVRADNGCVSSGSGTIFGALKRHLRRDDGQAMVEFALIAPLFLAIVVGIIQFGVALNFWLDMQRIANQGARWAVVNNWPACPRTSANTVAPHASDGCTDTLQTYLAASRGAEGEDLNIVVCFPDASKPPPDNANFDKVGHPVKVVVSQRFRFMQIVPMMPSINIGASATMRIEQDRGRYTTSGTTC
jgi:Flp pilus assembly protein TadG